MRNLKLAYREFFICFFAWTIQFKMECWGSNEGVCKGGWNGYTFLPFFFITRVCWPLQIQIQIQLVLLVELVQFVELGIQFNWNLYQHWVCDANVAKCDFKMVMKRIIASQCFLVLCISARDVRKIEYKQNFNHILVMQGCFVNCVVLCGRVLQSPKCSQ
jgi:hypothetical protein